MAALASVFVEVQPDTQNFSRDLTSKLRRVDASRAGVSIGQSLGGGMRASLSKSIGGIGGLLAGAFAAVKGIQVFGSFVQDARESAKISRITANAIRTTGGAAKISAAQVGDLSTAISNKTGVDDEAIQSGSNLLLTFKAVRNEVGRGNDIFNRATAAAIDLSAAGFGSIDGASKQLGKALQEPIKGISALSRAGVTFTKQQKDQIKTLVESGNVLGAQRIILKEVEGQVGGAARAASDPLDRLKVIAGNLGEEIGGFLLPAIGRFSDFVSERVIPGIKGLFTLFRSGDLTSGLTKAFGVTEDSKFIDFLFRARDAAIGLFKIFATGEFSSNLRKAFNIEEDSGFVTFLLNVRGAVVGAFGYIRDVAIPALVDFGKWLVKNRDWLIPVAAGIGAIVVAVKVWTVVSKAFVVVQGLVNAVLTANPVGLVVLALVGLTAALVVAYNRSETFRTIVQAAWRGIQTTVGFAWNNIIKPAFAALSGFVTNVLGPAISWLWRNVVVPAFNGIRGVIQIVWPIVRGIFQTWVAFLRNVVGPAISWLWRNVVVPAFNGIRAVIEIVWVQKIRPVLAALGNFIRDKVAPAFRAGVDAIGRAWNAIKEKARTPVNFIIGTVLNRGIFAAYNWVVRKFGGTEIPALPLVGSGGGGRPTTAGLRDGGPVRGSGTGRSDSIYARLSNGEFIVNALASSRHRELLESINSNRFADGGIVGAGVKEGLRRAAGVVPGDLSDPARYMRGKVAGALRGIGGSAFAHTLVGIPRKIGSILVEKVKGLFAGVLRGGFFGAGGNWPARQLGVLSGNTAAAVAFVRQMFGIGNIGTLGNRPNASDHPFGKALDAMIPNWQSPAGIALGNRIASWFVANPGRFGTKYVIWRDQINSGRGWAPYTHPNGPTSNPTLRHMDHVHVSLLDQGGWLKPGVNVAVNRTGQPEQVLPPGGAGRTFNVTVHNAPDKPTERAVYDVLDRLAIMHGF